MQYVTKTGRAPRLGRTTRKSLAVKRPKAKPLPMHLQCHPPTLHRTPTHPHCSTFEQRTGGMLDIALFQTLLFREGQGLSKSGPIRVEVDGHGTFRHHDVAEALAWAKAARRASLTVNVYTGGA